MRTFIRICLLLLFVLGALYFFTFRVKGRHVEIEMKKEPNLHEVKSKAAEVEKKALDSVKKAIPSGKNQDVRPPQKPHGDEPTEEDREALRKIIREKLEKE